LENRTILRGHKAFIEKVIDHSNNQRKEKLILFTTENSQALIADYSYWRKQNGFVTERIIEK